jgi:hypothetical protein
MLLDLALDTKSKKMLTERTHKYLNGLRPKVKRFVFDSDASHRLGHFAVNQTDTVCAHAPDLKPPFPNTYIEIDAFAGLKGSDREIWDGAAPRMGFLFTENGHCFPVIGDDKYAFFEAFVLTPAGNPFGHTPFPDLDDELKYRTIKFLLMIGQTNSEKIKKILSTYRSPYLDAYEIGLTRPDLPAELVKGMVAEGIGVFKRAMTALMLLSEKINPKYQRVAATRRFIGSKFRAVPAHSIVTIDLDDDRIKRIYSGSMGTGQTHALHDVEEHWVTYDLSSQCRHVFEEYRSVEGERRDMEVHGHLLVRQACIHCGGRRTRRLSHERGDRTKPKKPKTYRVIASKEKS